MCSLEGGSDGCGCDCDGDDCGKLLFGQFHEICGFSPSIIEGFRREEYDDETVVIVFISGSEARSS